MMNSTEQILVYLLSAAIRGEKVQEDKIQNINWEAILEQAKEQNIYSIIYPIIKDLDTHHRPENNIIDQWKKQTILTGINQQRNINQMGLVLASFNKENIPVIGLKGLILREFYPQKELRTMSDVDLLIQEKNLDKSRKVLLSMGYSEDEKDLKHIVFSNKDHLPIELHWALIDSGHFKHAEYLEDDIWKNTNKINIYGATVLTPSIENQILHLCLHMVTHFVYSGFGLRQLCDLVLFVESEINRIDWNRFYNKVKRCKIEKFTFAIFEICRRFFDMDVPNILYDKNLKDNKYVDMIEESIISKGAFEGVFGKESFESFSPELLLYCESNESSKKNFEKIRNFLRFLFPSLPKMIERYEYVDRYNILLPIAWTHRIIHGIMRKDISMNEKSTLLLSDSNILQERAKLFKWLDLQ